MQAMTGVQYVAAAVGALPLFAAFIYKGTHNGIFVLGQRELDKPPNFVVQVLL